MQSKIVFFFWCMYTALYGAPNVLVSHGFGATASGTIGVIWPLMPTDGDYSSLKQGTLFIQEPHGAWKECILKNDAPLDPWNLNLRHVVHNNKVVVPEYADNGIMAKSHMGQGADIEKLQEAVSLFSQERFFAIGHSRGAAALINFVSQHNPSNLQGLVLFAAPSSIPAVISEKIFGNCIGSERLVHAALSVLSNYPLRAPSMDTAIQKIDNKDLPVLILHRNDDRVIGAGHAIRLYQSFLDAGFKNVYVKILQQGGHSDFFVHGSDTEIVTLFYKAYGIEPIDPQELNILEEKLRSLSTGNLRYASTYFTLSNAVALSVVCGACYLLYQKFKKCSEEFKQDSDNTALSDDTVQE